MIKLIIVYQNRTNYCEINLETPIMLLISKKINLPMPALQDVGTAALLLLHFKRVTPFNFEPEECRNEGEVGSKHLLT